MDPISRSAKPSAAADPRRIAPPLRPDIIFREGQDPSEDPESLKTAILSTEPTSYWPLTDVTGASCRDEMGLHDALVNSVGGELAAIPFGAASAPYFDGEIGSVLTVDDDPRYSQPYANALSVAAWVCPLALNNAYTGGSTDQ